MHYLFFMMLTSVVALSQIIIAKAPLIETLLLCFLVINIGFSAPYVSIGHSFKSEKVPKYIGWPAGNPFQ